MKQFPGEKIKNIALAGHGGSGKTTLADAILFYGKASERIGSAADGSSLMDFDAEEKKRKVSLSTACYALELDDYKLNLIDIPGQFDFAGGVSEGLAACDGVLITLSGKSGVTVGAKQAYDKAKAAGKAIGFFIGKLDSTHAHFYQVLSLLTGLYGASVCPIYVPYIEGENLKGFVDLIENKAYSYDGLERKEIRMPVSQEIDNLRSVMLEAVATVDEELMMKYLEGEELTKDEILSGLKAGVKTGDIYPVYAGIQSTGAGIPDLVSGMLAIMPSAADSIALSDDGEEISADINGECAVNIFKTIADPFVGKLSYFKVISGKLKPDTRLKNNRTGNEERLSKVMYLKGAKQEDATEIIAGDIGCVSKLGDVLTGDTLSLSGNVKVADIVFPRPCLSMAVYPVKKGDEEKISSGLNRLAEEDPTIAISYNNETHEQIISALGEQHIDVIISKLKAKFGADVELKAPKVAYRETIRKAVKAQGRHKKQSGGHGQFGDVWIEFEPCDSDDLVFEEKIFGGAVPKNFFPAVEKGLRDSITRGVLAGYPMVGIKATLVDGSYHPVDSSEMAFKTAASLAFKEGVSQANPVLMEPIGTLKVLVPDEMLGDVIGDINKRRGRIIGMNPAANKMQEVLGEVPVAEMSDFATAMRSITQGTATFTLEFARYEDVPASIAQGIIDAAKEE